MAMKPICVVGAGLAGLSAAACLSKAGLPVVVLEAADHAGGRARSWIDDATGDVVDIGPHVLLSAYVNMLDWLDELGTRSDIRWQQDCFLTLMEGRTPFVLRSRRLPAPLPFLPSILAIRKAPLRERLQAARVLWKTLSLTDEELNHLDRCTGEHFLREQGVGKPMMDWYWRSLSLFLLNVPLERCSAAALVNLFRLLVSQNHLALGFATKGLGELYVPAASALIRSRGGSVQTGQRVRSLELREGRVTALDVNDRRIEASSCVIAVGPNELRKLLPESLRAGPFRNLGIFRPAPYVSVYLWFERRITQQCFWARPWTAAGLTADAYDLANIRNWPAGAGSLVALNVINEPQASGLTDDGLIARVRSELEENQPDARQGLRRARVHRIPMAIPAPEPGTETARPGQNTGTAGLFVCGDWTRTGLPASMESAVRSGRLAAEAVCASVGQTRRFAKPIPAPQGLLKGWMRFP